MKTEWKSARLLVENIEPGLWRVTSDDGFVHVLGPTLRAAFNYVANVMEDFDSDPTPAQSARRAMDERK